MKTIELIDKYIVKQSDDTEYNPPSYIWTDNTGEIVRCRDCKHWALGKTTKNYPNPYICDFHSFMHGFERSALPEDYCSWGERKNG